MMGQTVPRTRCRVIEDYSTAETEVGLSSLVELGQKLQPYREDVILRGGFASYLLTKGLFDYCGFHNINFAVKKNIPKKKGKTIREIVEGLGYDLQPYPAYLRDIQKKVLGYNPTPYPPALGKFSKTVIGDDDKEYTIRLDFACTSNKDCDAHDEVYWHCPQVQEDLYTNTIYCLDIAFVFNFETEIEAVVGDRTEKTALKVTDLVSTLALNWGTSAKKFYNIFALTHYNGGPLQAAESFKQLVANKKISEVHQRFIKASIWEMYQAFEGKFPVGAFRVEEFDKRQNEDVVVKQVNQFIEPVRQFLSTFP